MNLASTGIIPSINLLVANRDRYDFDKLGRHSYHYTQAPEGLKKSMSPDCMKVVIHA